MKQHTDEVVETALRYAAETWMQLNNVITVTRKGEVLPPFFAKLCAINSLAAQGCEKHEEQYGKNWKSLWKEQKGGFFDL